MRTQKLSTIGLLLVFLLSFVYAEDYSQWSYSMNCIINTYAIGVSDNVTNFPLLIGLSEINSDVFDNAKENGEDIRFSKQDGSTPLPYQIEKWDKAGEVAEIWVKLDVIEGSNSEQFIKMYWGNPDAATESAGSSVFGSIDYAGVWHLGSMDDASGPGGSDNDGINHYTEYVSGIIGNAVDFSGQDWIDIPTAAFSGISNQITIELWQYGDPYYQPQDDRIVWARDAYGNRTLNVVIPWSDEHVVWDAGNSSYCFNRIEKIATSTEYEGQWNHWVFTKNATEGSMRIYLNGSLWHSEESGNTYQINIENGFRLGADNCGSQNYDGRLDEFRVSNIARSSAWAKLSYENQKEGQTVITFQEGEEYKCPMSACIGDNVLVDGAIKFGINAVYSDDSPDPKPDQPILCHGTSATGISGLEDGVRLVYDPNFLDGNHPTDDVLRIEKTDGNQLTPDGGIAFVNLGKEGNQYKTETAMFIKGDGKIGIGTETPEQKLDINDGTVKISKGWGDWLQFKGTKTDDGTWGIHNPGESNATPHHLEFYHDPSEDVSNDEIWNVLVLNNDGNVGIGTNNPGGNKLSVNGRVEIGNSDPNDDDINGILRLSHNVSTNYRSWDIGVGDAGIAGLNDNLFVKDGNMNDPALVVERGTGNIGIGTNNPEAELDVNGTIKAADITLDNTITAEKFKVGKWIIESPPDYVFSKDYKLRPLKDLEHYIKKHSHLPEIPNAKAIEEEGIDLVEMNMLLLRKVEELTLYTIKQNKKINRLEKLEKEIEKIKSELRK